MLSLRILLCAIIITALRKLPNRQTDRVQRGHYPISVMDWYGVSDEGVTDPYFCEKGIKISAQVYQDIILEKRTDVPMPLVAVEVRRHRHVFQRWRECLRRQTEFCLEGWLRWWECNITFKLTQILTGCFALHESQSANLPFLHPVQIVSEDESGRAPAELVRVREGAPPPLCAGRCASPMGPVCAFDAAGTSRTFATLCELEAVSCHESTYYAITSLGEC